MPGISVGRTHTHAAMDHCATYNGIGIAWKKLHTHTAVSVAVALCGQEFSHNFPWISLADQHTHTHTGADGCCSGAHLDIVICYAARKNCKLESLPASVATPPPWLYTIHRICSPELRVRNCRLSVMCVYIYASTLINYNQGPHLYCIIYYYRERDLLKISRRKAKTRWNSNEKKIHFQLNEICWSCAPLIRIFRISWRNVEWPWPSWDSGLYP